MARKQQLARDIQRWVQRKIAHRKGFLGREECYLPAGIKFKNHKLQIKWKKVYLDNEVPAIIQDVVRNTGLVNKDGDAPKQLDKHKEDWGWIIIYELVPGVNYFDFASKIYHFAHAVGGWAESTWKDGRVILKIYTRKFDDVIFYDFNPEDYKMQLPIPVGVDRSGELIVRDLMKFPHLFIAGAPNYGKTRAIFNIIAAVTTTNNAIVAVIDYKRIDFEFIKDRIVLAKEDETALKLMRWVVKEAERRTRLLNKYLVSNWQEYREKTGSNEPYFILVFDEVAEVKNDDIMEYLDTIVRVYRACGIHVVAATQYPILDSKKGGLKASTRRMFLAKLCFVMENDSASKTVLDCNAAARIEPKQGRAVWKFGLELQEVQTFYLTNERMLQLVPKAAGGWIGEQSQKRLEP